MISALDALGRLLEGNRRFAAGRGRGWSASADELRKLAAGQAQAPPAGPLGSIVRRIQPSVEALLRAEPAQDPETLLREAVRANVRAAARQLRLGSEVIQRWRQREGLLVVGAEYAIETGEVAFFDGLTGS